MSVNVALHCQGADFMPLRIEWRLRDGLVLSGHPLHLDGLLHEVFGDPSLILKRLGEGADWVYCASALMLEGQVLREGRITLKMPSIQETLASIDSGWESRSAKLLDTTIGDNRGHLIRYTTALPEVAVAGAVGKPEKLAEVLREVTHLGGERRLGGGEVISCTITQDESEVLWQNRLFPSPRANAIPVLGRAQPPYYQRNSRAMVWWQGWEKIYE